MVDLHDLQNALNKTVSCIALTTLDRFLAHLMDKQDVVKDDPAKLQEVMQEIMTEFKKTLPSDHFQIVPQTKKKETRATRVPNAYNMFIRDKMKEIKLQNPSMTGKDLLKQATVEWNNHKQNNLPLSQSNNNE
jgi:hypothetical protein